MTKRVRKPKEAKAPALLDMAKEWLQLAGSLSREPDMTPSDEAISDQQDDILRGMAGIQADSVDGLALKLMLAWPAITEPSSIEVALRPPSARAADGEPYVGETLLWGAVQDARAMASSAVQQMFPIEDTAARREFSEITQALSEGDRQELQDAGHALLREQREAHPDAALLDAWNDYVSAARALESMPDHLSEQEQEPHWRPFDDAQDRLGTLPARTPAGLAVKLRFAFDFINGSPESRAAAFNDAPPPETLLADLGMSTLWNSIQSAERMAHAAAPREASQSADTPVLEAWEEYVAAMRVVDALPNGTTEAEIKPYHEAADKARERLLSLPAFTPAGLAVKLRYLFASFAGDHWGKAGWDAGLYGSDPGEIRDEFSFAAFWDVIQAAERMVVAERPNAALRSEAVRIIEGLAPDQQQAAMLDLMQHVRKARTDRVRAGEADARDILDTFLDELEPEVHDARDAISLVWEHLQELNREPDHRTLAFIARYGAEHAERVVRLWEGAHISAEAAKRREGSAFDETVSAFDSEGANLPAEATPDMIEAGMKAAASVVSPELLRTIWRDMAAAFRADQQAEGRA